MFIFLPDLLLLISYLVLKKISRTPPVIKVELDEPTSLSDQDLAGSNSIKGPVSFTVYFANAV